MINWKYTKGSEKDFDGAPDWVNYRVEGTLGFEYYVGEMVEGGYFVPCSRPLQEPSKMTGLFKKCSIAAQREPVTAWGGEGIPPVGVECEFFRWGNLGYIDEITPDDGTIVEIVAHKVSHDGNNVAVAFWHKDGGCRSSCFVAKSFRPIKSESERRRSETLDKIYGAMLKAERGGNRADMADCVYDAIAAGKIPHVKLEG